ncbi:reverse transcriptase domain-containing protein [Tanacetum coccineum]
MFPVLSRMAMDIISVQASSVASESAFSTSGRVLSIRRTRLTPASLEMCMCLKDHLDAKERKQDKCPLETPLDFEEGVFDDEVQQNEAIPLSDEEIALDASSEGTMSPGGPRRSRSPRTSVFSRMRSERSRSPRQRSKEGGVFKRLGSRGKSVSPHSDNYNRNSYSKCIEALSESENSEGGHWKSRSKMKKSCREYDDLSQPWVCEKVDPFTPRIRYFDFPKTRMPSHIKTYDESEDPEDHLKIFQAAAKTERWAMPTWCHMFNSTLTGNARNAWNLRIPARIFTNPELIKRLHDKIPKTVDEMMRVTTSFLRGEVAASNHEWKKMFPPWKQHEGNQKQNFKKGGFRNQQRSASEILYEHYFSRLRLEIKKHFIPATTPLIGLSGEIIWPIGQIQLLVTIGDEEHSALAWMNFMVVRSSSLYNGIVGRPGVRKLQAVPSTAHRMLKIPVEGGVITLKSSKLVSLECTVVSGHEGAPSATKPIIEERIKKPADMTGVPRHIAEHRLNVREGCYPVRQKKRGQAADRNQAIQEEVGKFMEAGIMKEVQYHDWLSNPIMVTPPNLGCSGMLNI